MKPMSRPYSSFNIAINCAILKLLPNFPVFRFGELFRPALLPRPTVFFIYLLSHTMNEADKMEQLIYP